MGQKVHPTSFRLGYIKDWSSRWFATKKDFPKFLKEDIIIRKHLKKSLASAAVALIEVERAGDKVRVSIHSARPGIIIGRRGAEIDRIKEELQDMIGRQVFLDIKEIKNPQVVAQLVAENIAFQLEKRIAFRRAMKKSIQAAMNAGAQGIKISCAGRLGGAEIARTEGYKEGKVPLQTLRADIDYGFTEARTAYGAIGIKVWVYKGDIMPKAIREAKEKDKAAISGKKQFKNI
ncbi:MAG: 30S ribosomal protein S3 [Candidatus Omnitrophica bacterium]|nr:30S ribosomal protein S3 [Candidatus Omnitrophota bacterium]